MKDGPDIARIAALIGDPARANILSALMGGKALTATELAAEAGVTAATASGHLAKLSDGHLLAASKQGRHRYYRLAGAEVAATLESLMGLAQHTGATRVRTGPRDPELRHARICYDHLAGEMGVALMDGLLQRKAIILKDETATLTKAGEALMRQVGLDPANLKRGRRLLCRPCLDWSVRRPHLAGALGAGLWDHIQTRGWAKRDPESRVIRFSKQGDAAFRSAFGLPG